MTWKANKDFLWFKAKQEIPDAAMQEGWKKYCTESKPIVEKPVSEPEPEVRTIPTPAAKARRTIGRRR